MTTIWAAVVLLALVAAAPAGARIYWADEGTGAVGRARDDGTRAEPAWIGGLGEPRAVTVDGTSLYWAQGDESGSIGRARLDGSGVERAFLRTGAFPTGVAVAAGWVYWSHSVARVSASSAAAGTERHVLPSPRAGGNVGRARLNGVALTATYVATGSSPCGVAVDADKVYWGLGTGMVGRSHGAFEAEPGWVRGARDPCGVAVTDRYVYWANRGAGTVGRARLDGSEIDQRWITGLRAPCGVAADGRHVYWADRSRGTIGRAGIDGRDVRPAFIRGARSPCGVAATPRLRVERRSVSFAPGAIEALVFTNVGSASLGITAVKITGRDASAFAVTGDGCSVGALAPGASCVVNVRFIGVGARGARLSLAGSARNSPAVVALKSR